MGSLGQTAPEFFLPEVILKRCTAERSDPKEMDLERPSVWLCCGAVLEVLLPDDALWFAWMSLTFPMKLTHISQSPSPVTHQPGHTPNAQLEVVCGTQQTWPLANVESGPAPSSPHDLGQARFWELHVHHLQN